MGEKCYTCRFWKNRDTAYGEGECRRYAPRPTTKPRTTGDGETLPVLTYWPETSQDDWCGEYAAGVVERGAT